MRNIDRYFFGLAIIAGATGMTLGIVMGILHDFSLVPVHAHVNLVGWVSLALFGVGYRLGLARSDKWAVAHFWLAAASVVVFPLGIYISITQDKPGIAILGSLLTLGSMLLFLANFVRARGA